MSGLTEGAEEEHVPVLVRGGPVWGSELPLENGVRIELVGQRITIPENEEEQQG